MAYIDLDEINRLHPKLTVKYPLSFANGISAAINEINRLPNADVVPKSEVESIITLNSQLEAQVFEQRKEIERLNVELDAMRGAANSLKMHYEKAEAEVERLKYNLKAVLEEIPETKRELASEIFAEIENLFLNNHIESFQNFHDNWIYRFKVNMMTEIDKLKKKYTEGEE